MKAGVRSSEKIRICHAERSEASAFAENKGTRFLAALGMTWQDDFFTASVGCWVSDI
ncbi:MAG: hypothetical protein ACRD4Q_02005 [Candidatus Acidiferrales bacterium]